MIRKARIDDHPHLRRMARDFARALNRPYDAAWVDAWMRASVQDAHRLALVLDLRGAVRGMLFASIGQTPLSPDPVAVEQVFWIDPDARGPWAARFIARYEEWARASGCVAAGLASTIDHNVASLYARRGFAPVEQHHMKLF